MAAFFITASLVALSREGVLDVQQVIGDGMNPPNE